MENKDDFLRFETGHVIKFINGKKELKESDFRTIETKKLYDFFSGEDGNLDVKDYKNLWNMVKEFANKNGNPELLDDNEKLALLEEINKNSEEKFKISTLNDFLLKVFQMPDKIELDDTAQLLNIPFHEMRETKLEDKANKEKEILSKVAFAEMLFNPNNNKNIVENYVDNKLQSKTIADEDGNIIRAIFYDENGEVSRVEIKKETGWEITNFKPDYGTYSIIKTGVDKNIPQTETVMFNSIVYKQIEYSSIEFYTEYTYSLDEHNNLLQDITEYKNNKRSKTIWYNKEGQKCRTIEYIYSNDFCDGNLPVEIRTYNARGKLIETIDNKTNKTFDENGNEIKEEEKSEENEIIADLLLKNFSTENLNLINKNNVLEVMHTYEVYTMKFDENANEYGREKLIDKILSNENLSEKKEQLKILIGAIRDKVPIIKDKSGWASDTMIQSGLKLLNKIIDECLLDSVDDKTIKSNIEKVVYIIEDPYYAFNGFAHSDIPNGKIDKLSYQNAIGDCWLLASLDSLSELECGQDYLEQFIENDSEKQEVSIKLDGGKTVYTFSYDEINNAYKFSVGDADTKALEMAYDKYFKEFKPEGDDNIDGNWMRNAFAILSGNKPVDAIVLDGKAGIMMDGEFIEICKNNRDKLKHIPIDIQRVTPEIMAQIKEVQDFTAKTTISASLNNNSSHAFYITDISDKNHITVKEPNSPNLARTYTQEYYFKVYDNLMTIFIM